MPLVYLLPVIAAIADAVYLTVTKFFFRKYGKFSNREFIWVLFATIVGILLAALPSLGVWPSWVEVQTVAWPLVGLVVLATIHNLLSSWAIEHEHISEVQPFLMFTPLMAILVVSIFYPDERIWQIYLASGIAGVLLIWSHLKKSHFVWSPGLAAICGFIVLYGFEVVLLRQLLPVFPPLILYLVRCGLILLALTGFARPDFSMTKPRHMLYFILLGGLAVLSTWAAYTAFTVLGINHTLFVFVLSSVLVYWFSALFLAEKWQLKNIITSAAIVGLVLWVSTIQ